ncbi:hypothetical protein ACIBSV_10275 [Embleya sp. NPDC050154]|uniref:hypothetical protein n=1 Tax=Embleya sp. NPDC050154 TaxID=3363988 RepID=UPI003790ED75
MFMARPRHVGFTLDSDTPYSGGILDLRESGPTLIEPPPGPLVGSVGVTITRTRLASAGGPRASTGRTPSRRRRPGGGARDEALHGRVVGSARGVR